MRFDAGQADCHVFTYKEGPLSPLGHDLELRVTRFAVEISEDGQLVEARFEAASLELVGAVVNGRSDTGALSARDRASIEGNIRDDVLQARQYPEIKFRSSGVEPGLIRGQLTLHGRTREISCRHEISGTRHLAEARLQQTDFGIKPYRAMLGALRVRADVLVRLTLTL